MHFDLNKRHTVTQVLHNSWREIQTTQFVKCPLKFDCTRQKRLGNPNLKVDTSTMASTEIAPEVLICISQMRDEELYSQAQILWKTCLR